ncbi:hypothetical protein [Terricaulis sp.]
MTKTLSLIAAMQTPMLNFAAIVVLVLFAPIVAAPFIGAAQLQI